MSKQMTFLELAEAVLEKAEYPLGYKEIWEQAKIMGLTNQMVKGEWKFKTPPQNIMQIQLHDNIRQKKDNSKFYKASIRPTTFWLQSRKNELDSEKLNAKIQKDEIEAESKSQKNQKQQESHERDLHPLLVKFLFSNESFKIRAKTIYHEKCKKQIRGKSKWNYPDIVGVKFPFDRKPETLNLLSNINQGEYKLYSFELKKSIDFSDLKECYFQAVSNSSWANEGYLVVFDDIDIEVLKELRRLNASFGIGVIQLRVSEIDSKIGVLESEVILPSAQRNLDIETLDMLVGESPCFEDFINDISKHIGVKQQNIKSAKSSKDEIYVKDTFDEVLDDDKLDKYIKENKIIAE